MDDHWWPFAGILDLQEPPGNIPSTLFDGPTPLEIMAGQLPPEFMMSDAVEPQTPAGAVNQANKRQAEAAEEPEGPPAVKQKLAGTLDFDVLCGEQQAGPTEMQPAETPKMKLETQETVNETPLNSIEDIFEGLETATLTSPLHRAVRKLLFAPFQIPLEAETILREECHSSAECEVQ